MKEAVNNAYATPYAVTLSTYPPDGTNLADSDPRNNPNQKTLCEELKSGFAIYLPKK